jgi:hypothetical protein
MRESGSRIGALISLKRYRANLEPENPTVSGEEARIGLFHWDVQ